jgi:hypothetical protein
MILSALRIVDKRCAITNVVRPIDKLKIIKSFKKAVSAIPMGLECEIRNSFHH